MADFVSALKADLVEQFRGKENIEGLVKSSASSFRRSMTSTNNSEMNGMSIPPWASSLTAWVTLL